MPIQAPPKSRRTPLALKKHLVLGRLSAALAQVKVGLMKRSPLRILFGQIFFGRGVDLEELATRGQVIEDESCWAGFFGSPSCANWSNDKRSPGEFAEVPSNRRICSRDIWAVHQ